MEDDLLIEIQETAEVNLLKRGAWHGAGAGCWSSSAFILIIFLFFSFVGDKLSYGLSSYLENATYLSVFIGFLGIPFGLIPAVVIGSGLGVVTSLIYRKFQGALRTVWRSMAFGAVISLMVALPLISFWWSFFFAGFKISGIEFGIPTYANRGFIPFCILAGMIIGRRLYQEVNIVREPI